MKVGELGRGDGSYFDIPSKLGDEIICLQAEVHDTVQKFGDLIKTSTKTNNYRMFYYKIVAQGDKVNEKTGLNVGDFVFVDMYSRFADTHPISFVNCKNVIFKTDSTGTAIEALNGRLIAKVIEPTEINNRYGFIQKSDIDPYGEVISIGKNCPYRSINVGDIIGLVDDDDTNTIMLHNVKYFDYSINIPIFKYSLKDEVI